jgi:hypothetical protein
MPETQTQPTHADESGFGALLGAHKGVTKPKAQPSATGVVEPTMRAMRRILGDSVLDIFPAGIAKNVDELFDICSEDTEFWAEIQCESVTERNDLLALMRAYAECAGEKGYTIRQDRTAPAHVLRTRVIPRKGSGKDSDE